MAQVDITLVISAIDVATCPSTTVSLTVACIIRRIAAQGRVPWVILHGDIDRCL